MTAIDAKILAGLTDRHAGVLQLLADAAIAGEICPTNLAIGAQVGISDAAASKSVSLLEGQGLIEVSRFNSGRHVRILAPGRAQGKETAGLPDLPSGPELWAEAEAWADRAGLSMWGFCKLTGVNPNIFYDTKRRQQVAETTFIRFRAVLDGVPPPPPVQRMPRPKPVNVASFDLAANAGKPAPRPVLAIAPSQSKMRGRELLIGSDAWAGIMAEAEAAKTSVAQAFEAVMRAGLLCLAEDRVEASRDNVLKFQRKG